MTNRYVIDGLAADLRSGKNVALMGKSRIQSFHAFCLLVEQLGDEAVKVRRTNGSESITHSSGGRLDVQTGSHGPLRETSADVVVFLGWSGLGEKQCMEIYDAYRMALSTRPLDFIQA